MKRQWHVRRQTHTCPDGQRRWNHRWNQSYQLLLEWTTPGESPTTPTPTTATVSPPVDADQEANHAHCDVCPRLDPATSPAADQ
jgi:hypothetical protein